MSDTDNRDKHFFDVSQRQEQDRVRRDLKNEQLLLDAAYEIMQQKEAREQMDSSWGFVCVFVVLFFVGRLVFGLVMQGFHNYQLYGQLRAPIRLLF